jgi:nucleoside-diphosphate-sugar epimerase
MERIRVTEAVKMILEYMEVDVPLRFRPDMPTGPYNRVASNQLARDLLDWEPRFPFRQGIRHTIDWYIKNRNPEQIRANLESMLTER